MKDPRGLWKTRVLNGGFREADELKDCIGWDRGIGMANGHIDAEARERQKERDRLSIALFARRNTWSERAYIL